MTKCPKASVAESRPPSGNVRVLSGRASDLAPFTERAARTTGQAIASAGPKKATPSPSPRPSGGACGRRGAGGRGGLDADFVVLPGILAGARTFQPGPTLECAVVV